MKRALLVLLLACDPAIDRSYFVHPLGESFAPESGRSTGGEAITILGRGLDRVDRVTIGGVEAEIDERSDISIRVLAPPHAIGDASVVLESERSFEFEERYRYLPSRIQFGAERLEQVPGVLAIDAELDGDPGRELAIFEQRWVENWGEGTILVGEPGEPLKPAYEVESFSPSPDDSELQAVDLDRDGLDDLILYTWSWYDTLHDIHVLMNQGDGTFAGGPIADNLDLTEGDFFAADLDGDGATDFGWMGATLMVFWAHGDGTFDPPQTYDVWSEKGRRGSTLASHAIGDELFAVNLDAREVARVHFEVRAPIFVRTPYASTSTIVALVGSDVVLSDGSSLWVDRDAHGTPEPMPALCRFPRGVDRPFARTAVGDLNGDAIPDLYGWTLNDDGCVLYGDGNGGFSDPHAVPYDGNSIQGALIADFDGDGIGDLLRIEQAYLDDALIWHRLFFGPGLTRVPRLANGTVPIIDGGEVLTVIGDRTVVAIRGEEQRILYQEDFGGSTRVADRRDYTGDGTPDLLLMTRIDGGERPTLIAESGVQRFDGIHLGHFPGAIATLEDGQGELWRPSGATSFGVTIERPQYCLSVFDLDGDTLPELVQTCLEDRIIVGDQSWSIDYWLWDRPLFVDVDDDGDLDLMGTGENGVMEIRFNEGGRFDELVTLDLGSELSFQGTADVDGDGVRELLIYRGGIDLELLRWRTPRQLDGPYAIQDLAHHDPPWREAPLFAIDFPDQPGVLRHEDLTGDGLADLLLFTREGPWPYSKNNLVLLPNVSW